MAWFAADEGEIANLAVAPSAWGSGTGRRLLNAARALRDQSAVPPGAEDAGVYRAARSGYLVSDDQTPWREVYDKRFDAAVHPAHIPLRAAE